MSKTYDQFFPWVLPEVVGCPEIVAIRAIRDSVIDFCEQSLIHQASHDAVSAVAQQATYDLESPVTGTTITKVMRVWYMGAELEPVAPDNVNDPTTYNQQIGGVTTRYNTPRAFTQADPETITLLPIPDQSVDNCITMRVALAPLRASTACEDFLFEQWVEDIAHGAVARLQSSPGKTYSNPQFAAAHMARFAAGVNRARQEATRGFARPQMRVQMRRI